MGIDIPKDLKSDKFSEELIKIGFFTKIPKIKKVTETIEKILT